MYMYLRNEQRIEEVFRWFTFSPEMGYDLLNNRSAKSTKYYTIKEANHDDHIVFLPN